MDISTELKDKIFSVKAENFGELALEVFRFQARVVPVYREYLSLLKCKPEAVRKVSDIPFLPISIFKSHDVIAEGLHPAIVFESSRTTGMVPSRHLVADAELYDMSLLRTFQLFFGEPQMFTFLSLLPSYLERKGSSLVYMMESLNSLSGKAASGFYLDKFDELHDVLSALDRQKEKVFFTGVSFALMDFAEQYPMQLRNTIVMETGGMKGRRKELIRDELHTYLKTQLGLDAIASEYGMTELLSQAYALHNGKFHCPPWMQVHIREANDPFNWVENGQTGGLSVIDLANLYSCSFIATQDLGKKHEDGGFEVIGRFDNADIRGCSLMYS